jgi:hypothetical protein
MMKVDPRTDQDVTPRGLLRTPPDTQWVDESDLRLNSRGESVLQGVTSILCSGGPWKLAREKPPALDVDQLGEFHMAKLINWGKVLSGLLDIAKQMADNIEIDSRIAIDQRVHGLLLQWRQYPG